MSSPAPAVPELPPTRPRLAIAHVTGETGFSGGEVQLFLLMQGLRDRGHRNTLLCPGASAAEREATRRGIEVRPIPARFAWSPRSVWGIRREILACAPDLVHLHTGRANWLGGLAAWQLGLPAVTTRRMDRPVRRNLRTRILYGSCVRRVVAISASVGRQLVAGGVPEAMTRVVRSSVDPAGLRPRAGREATRRSHGLAPDAPLLLVAASLVPRKGIDVLLRALVLLRVMGHRPALWLAGDGPRRARLERLARRLGVAEQVRFLGHRDDVGDLLAACDVFVLPSRREGLGVAALEAMALERPVVASRVGGLTEAVDHDRTGLLVPPDDPDALAGALARLLGDPALRVRLGRRGSERIRADFSVEKMVEAYERAYADVLDEARRP